MRKWIWTFGCGTPWAGKYVIVHTAHGDGRERVFEKYGQQNCAMSYLYDKGMAIAEKYGYQLLEVMEV